LTAEDSDGRARDLAISDRTKPRATIAASAATMTGAVKMQIPAVASAETVSARPDLFASIDDSGEED
jgi:hypothetical protein